MNNNLAEKRYNENLSEFTSCSIPGYYTARSETDMPNSIVNSQCNREFCAWGYPMDLGSH